MSALDDIQVGDWLLIVSTIKGSSFLLQQVTGTTIGLVRTMNYTFRRDGRSFSPKQKSLTARLATAIEIEQWQTRHKKGEAKPEIRQSEDERPEIVLGRYLTSVSSEEWARLGVAQLKKIRQALEKSRVR